MSETNCYHGRAPTFAVAGHPNIDRSEICGILHTIRNNIKGGDLVSTEILEKGVKAFGDTKV